MAEAEWQPIETAPKTDNDQFVLLSLSDGEESRLTIIGWWCSAENGWHERALYETADGETMKLVGPWQPTHWMPCPEPPKQGERT